MMMVKKNKHMITLAKDFKISHIDSAHAAPQTHVVKLTFQLLLPA